MMLQNNPFGQLPQFGQNMMNPQMGQGGLPNMAGPQGFAGPMQQPSMLPPVDPNQQQQHHGGGMFGGMSPLMMLSPFLGLMSQNPKLGMSLLSPAFGIANLLGAFKK